MGRICWPMGFRMGKCFNIYQTRTDWYCEWNTRSKWRTPTNPFWKYHWRNQRTWNRFGYLIFYYKSNQRRLVIWSRRRIVRIRASKSCIVDVTAWECTSKSQWISESVQWNTTEWRYLCFQEGLYGRPKRSRPKLLWHIKFYCYSRKQYYRINET